MILAKHLNIPLQFTFFILAFDAKGWVLKQNKYSQITFPFSFLLGAEKRMKESWKLVNFIEGPTSGDNFHERNKKVNIVLKYKQSFLFTNLRIYDYALPFV